jgi:hypothetical protein
MTRRFARTLPSITLLGAMLVSSALMSAQTDPSRFNGKPKFSEGKALGYFIWKEGDTWKIRWTTFGAEHRFGGNVVVEGGEITGLKRIDVDTERRVIAPGRPPRVVRGPRGRARAVAPGRAPVVVSRDEDRIEQENERRIQFATRTDDDIDGFDFKLKGDAQVLRFVLNIDGVPRPAEVEVGSGNFQPKDNPIVVRLRN